MIEIANGFKITVTREVESARAQREKCVKITFGSNTTWGSCITNLEGAISIAEELLRSVRDALR